MRHLYVAATLMELRGVFEFLPSDLEVGALYIKDSDAYLVAGVGVLQTALHLGPVLFSISPLAIVNLGICGVYNTLDADIGDVVWVSADSLADFGVSDQDRFLSPRDLGWTTPFSWSLQEPLALDTWQIQERKALSMLKGPMQGATVNRCTGSEIEANRYSSMGAQVETMEGAAVAAVAQQWKIPCIQIRSISNQAGPRDFSSWRINVALANLRKVLYVQD